MGDKSIETIKYIKSVSKKKPSFDRIKTHLLEIGDKTVNRKSAMVEWTLVELTSQCVPFLNQRL